MPKECSDRSDNSSIPQIDNIASKSWYTSKAQHYCEKRVYSEIVIHLNNEGMIQ
jgi:hypothetical protein